MLTLYLFKSRLIHGVTLFKTIQHDLTNFMGIPGQFQHPQYIAGVRRIATAARRHGKIAAFLAYDDRSRMMSRNDRSRAEFLTLVGC